MHIFPNTGRAEEESRDLFWTGRSLNKLLGEPDFGKLGASSMPAISIDSKGILYLFSKMSLK
jgi:hypothetical protein